MSYTPIFTGGTGRSGTTIIANLMHRHPKIHTSSPREIKFITDRDGLIDLIYKPIKVKSLTRQSQLKTIVRAVFPQSKNSLEKLFIEKMKNRWWSYPGKFGTPRGFCKSIERERFEKILAQFSVDFAEDQIQASRNLLNSIASAQITEDSVTYFVDSTPTNILHSNYINKLFPDSHFVNMIRDGRDVAISVVKERWGPNDHFEALFWWKERMLQGHQNLELLPQSQQITIELEDLVSHNRLDTYRDLLTFLKLENDTKMESYFNEVIKPEKMTTGIWKIEVDDPKRFDSIYQGYLEELQLKGVQVSK